MVGLPDSSSQVLAAVAVAGRPVPHRLLAAVTGLDEEALLAGLRAAVGRRLLVVLPDTDEYEVRHALLREVVAAAWERLGRPFEAAYARFRQAEALLAARAPRAQVATVLGPAHRTAVALGAAPLRGEIEQLARRGRTPLEDPVDPTVAPEAPSAAAALGLTRRETEVLALVAEGRTNRQIGQELFITPKTAGLHVSRILAKLGVTGRGEAAAIAHRLGLVRR
jgi:DNA-binding NarL/FixJ family response regulator